MKLSCFWFSFSNGFTSTRSAATSAGYDNTFDIIRHSVEIGLLALVMTPIILTGGIDLSVGSLLGLCAILFGKLWRDAGLSPRPPIICTLCIGALRWRTQRHRSSPRSVLPPLIVTLGTYSLFRGLAEAITHGVDTFTNFPASFLFLGQERFLEFRPGADIYHRRSSPSGCWFIEPHSAVVSARLDSLPKALATPAFPLNGESLWSIFWPDVVAALAAIIYTARLGQAKADAGTGYELYAITAVVLGGTSIFGGIGSVHGTLLGVAAIAVLSNGLVHARQPREVAGMLTGALAPRLRSSGFGLPKILTSLRPRRQTRPSNTQPTSA